MRAVSMLVGDAADGVPRRDRPRAAAAAGGRRRAGAARADARCRAPGELFVSPALRELLATAEGRRVLAPRLPGRVAGEIGPSGLLGPSELGFYAGARDLRPGGPVQRVDGFGDAGPATPLDPALALLVVIALVALLIPVGVVVGAAVRTGGEDRDRRLAALRLIGADERMARRIAAGEALVGAGLRGRARRSAFFVAAPQPGREASASRASASTPATCARRRCWARSSCSASRPRPSPSRCSRCGGWSPSRSVSSGAPRPAAPRRLWWRLVLPLVGLAAAAPDDAAGRGRRQLDAARARDHRAAGRRRRAAAVGRRARRRRPRHGSRRLAARGAPPAARPRRRVARGQRDRGRRRRRDRAADGLHRRAGRLRAGDRGRPEPRPALRHARRADRDRGRGRPAALGRRGRALGDRRDGVRRVALRRLVRGAARAGGDPRVRARRHVLDRGGAARPVESRKDPGGAYRDGEFATTARPGERAGRRPRVRARRRRRLRRASATAPPRSIRCSPSSRSSGSPPTPSSPSCAARCSRARRS